jgi:hypothetical protein
VYYHPPAVALGRAATAGALHLPKHLRPRKTSMKLQASCILMFVLSSLPGCSGAPPTGEVSGTVTYDGRPVPWGGIAVLTDSGDTAGCEIRDGSYRLIAPVGQVKVSIVGGDKTEPLKGGQNMDKYFAEKKKEREKLEKDFADGKIKELPKEPMHVARKYGDLNHSGLTLDVKPGKQTHDFALARLPEQENP